MWIAVGPWDPISISVTEETTAESLRVQLKEMLAPRLAYAQDVEKDMPIFTPDGQYELKTDDNLMDIAEKHPSAPGSPFFARPDGIVCPSLPPPDHTAAHKGSKTPLFNSQCYLGGLARTISAGEEHYLVVDYAGRLWSWGSGHHCKLGHGGIRDVPEPQAMDISVFNGVPIVSAVAGQHHSAALAADKRVYTWGCGDDGRLGHDDEEWVATPRPVSTKFFERDTGNAALLSAGLMSSAMITGTHTHHAPHTTLDCNHIYVTGWGASGKFGHDMGSTQLKPIIMASLRGHVVVDVACGGHHMLGVIAGGLLYSWGWGKHGVLGNESEEPQPIPAPVKGMAKVVVRAVAAGLSHSLALTNIGRVFAWGCGDGGRLGLGDEEDRLEPELVLALVGVPIVAIAAGNDHSIALTNDGRVYTWGMDTLEPTLVEELADTPIVAVSAGRQSCLALSRGRTRVYQWGRSIPPARDLVDDLDEFVEPIETDILVRIPHNTLTEALQSDESGNEAEAESEGKIRVVWEA